MDHARKFWNIDDEKKFFYQALQSFASPEQLFYKLDAGFFAYAPKGKSTEGRTLQSRNALIGRYTEQWCKNFLQPIAKSLGLYALDTVVCPELGLSAASPADIAFCSTNYSHQTPDHIKAIFEIKMSIVNNYAYNEVSNTLEFVGDMVTHKGCPSLLRSDSMLKAIGKAVNIRVSGRYASTIPIIIVGNSPISRNYIVKVDTLKQSGVIQGFISLYPESKGIEQSNNRGFQLFSHYCALQKYIVSLLQNNLYFFSSMIPKEKLGNIITVASKEAKAIEKAEKFFSLLREVSNE